MATAGRLCSLISRHRVPEGLKLEMDALVVVGLFQFQPVNPPGDRVPANGYSGSGSHFIRWRISATGHLAKWTFGFGLFTPFGLAAELRNFNDADQPTEIRGPLRRHARNSSHSGFSRPSPTG
jgi:hypothetical protein